MITMKAVLVMMVLLTRSGPTDIYEEVLQQKARCNVVLGSKNEIIQVGGSSSLSTEQS